MARVRGDLIRKIRRARGLSLRELADMAGIHFTYLARIERGENIPSLDKLHRIAEVLGVPVDELVEGAEREGDGDQARDLVRIPHLGTTHAGPPLWSEQVNDHYLLVPADMLPPGEADYFALTVSGDSMAPLIPEGATVIVRRQPVVSPGQVAVVYWPEDNSTHIRRVFRSQRRLVLQAVNPKYPPIILRRPQVRILGQVVKILVDVDSAVSSEPIVP